MSPMKSIVRYRCSSSWSLRCSLAGLCLGFGSAGIAVAQPTGLPAVEFPPENPLTVEKSTLGKALFWDEQLSSDNTMSCGTCHIPSEGGADTRLGVNPGFDSLFGTPDDILGSPGVSLTDGDDLYVNSESFGLLPQTTGRQAQSAIMSMYANELFWDGRASSEFVDPQTGDVVIASGGALESQALAPIVSSVEMAHEERSWDEVIDKLTRVRPLALASDLPPDLAALIEEGESYPAIFADAFGDPQITAPRIAMAIATYERTLLPDQTPFDAFVAGDPNAMSQRQINGLNAFNNSRCSACHIGAEFTGNGFRNIGLRPINEDQGRFEVLGTNASRGRFKVPSLRNLALRDRYMHNGQLSSLGEVFDFYARRNGQVSFSQNRDPLLNVPIAFPPPQQNAIEDFLINGLTDPRVAGEAFPFDRPILLSEQALDNPLVISDGIAGSGGVVPQIVALSPPNIGNQAFKVGIERALGGSQAWVVISENPPVGGLLSEDELLGPIELEGSGEGEGFATMGYPIADIVALDGQVRYMQWLIADPLAPNGLAASPAIQLTIFCSMNGLCVDHCPADMTGDGELNFFDVSAFLGAYSGMDPDADFTGDGNFDFFDVSAFLGAFSAGCF
jgi:cytochrome c peroxidase